MDLSDRLRDLSRPTGEEDLLAVKYPEPRIAIPAKQGMWVAVACILGLLCWLLLRDAPSTAHTFAPASPGASVSTPAPTSAVVSVVGAVSRPGLVTLAAGARVNDALEVADPLPEADVVAVNLAEKIVDGKQIVVPRVGEAPPPAAAASTGEPGMISLNSATAADLETLDGVGQKTAQAIITYRDSIGGFTSIEQLQEVKGIGPAKFAAISPGVTL